MTHSAGHDVMTNEIKRLKKQVLLDAVIQFEKYKQLNSFAVTLLRINMGFPQSLPDTRA